MTLDPVRPTTRHRKPTRLLDPRTQRLLLAVLLAAAAVAAWFGSGIPFQREILVKADGAVYALGTSATTVGEALRDARVSLGPHDRVSPAAGEGVTDGMVIEVRRAVPVVFRLDGRAARVLSAAETVGELLAASRLPVRADDRLEPERSAPVSAGLEVTVTRVVRSYQHREDPVPFVTVRREDMTMDLGQTKVVQEGATGLVRRLLLVTYENGKVVDTQELEKTVLKEPVERIVRVGTAGTIVRNGKSIRFLKALTVTSTAYEPGPISCGASADGYTCLGLRATKGIIAVDPRVIPLWTKVYVDGYGYAVAGDTGSAIKGNRIDVCFDTYEEAIRWGVRRVKVYILQLPGS